MTDVTSSDVPDTPVRRSTTEIVRSRLGRRYAAERRFKAYGLFAILISVAFLTLLVYTIVSEAIPAFTYNYFTVELQLDKAVIDPDGTADPKVVARANYTSLVRKALASDLPFVSGRQNRRIRNSLLSSGAADGVREAVVADPGLIGQTRKFDVLLSDFADLYFKGLITSRTTVATFGTASPGEKSGDIKILSTSNDFGTILSKVKAELAERAAVIRKRQSGSKRQESLVQARIEAAENRLKSLPASDTSGRARAEAAIKDLTNSLAAVRNQIESMEREASDLEKRSGTVNEKERLTSEMTSYLVYVNGGVVKLKSIDATSAEGEVLVPLDSTDDAARGKWSIVRLNKPEGSRKLNDKEIVWLEVLKQKGLIQTKFNSLFFTTGASRDPELAGIWGAVVGSFYTMIVTLLLSFPLGVMAAIYLEGFAPNNRWTRLIEVNINNLAAVPSIVFGLLGLAVFLNFFGMPRSAPVVGGMVLALMTLPTIIIAARAAIKAVPPSIKEAALGIGASPLQAMFHHVLPLAMPGIFTGTIIGMAQALGETAPLLMIGMVAFIVDIPGGPADPATVLPVQIYMWSDFPEPAFSQKTAAAILTLLGFLVAMNAVAVVLRKRFERRW